ncbi:MAG: 30S ribosomal protein S3 [Candidatus Melainabacteria bacterium RIFCSPHIGHO2_02_FULL_34_12]|nr:MAG: 30S ribosomal protein S3 [Candidatus Melainabacteria bacterium RIFCSPHIGHO2_02_FULL_34_12]
MGQKTHPKGFRLGVILTWDSQWYAPPKYYADLVLEDRLIREYIKRKLFNAGISKIEIWRKAQLIQVNIHSVRPGIVVGKGGQGLETLKNQVVEMINRKDVIVQINVIEVSKADLDAQLTSEAVAQQLERRVTFRKAMKQAMQRAMRAGAKGVKVMVSGRLGGNDIARTEWLRDGAIPLHTLRADIDYGFATAKTVFGIIGVKVWIYRGNVAPGEFVQRNIKPVSAEDLTEEELAGKRRRKRKEREYD